MYGRHPQYYGGPRWPAPPQQQPAPNYFSPPLPQQPPPPNYFSSPLPQQHNPYLENPSAYFQNPSFSTPPPGTCPHPQFFPTQQVSQSSNEGLQRIENAVSKAHQELLASGESVSAWKVSHSVLLALKSDSWNSLGFQIQQIPSLFRLMLVEGKVNAFIHCFVGVRKITSLHDLDVEICKSEGVQRFDELELGPLLRHPLVIHYFLVPSDTKEIVSITSQEIISYLFEFMETVKHKGIKTEEFLDFIAAKRSHPVKEKLGIRIQNLRMHVNTIREARKAEDSTLNKYIRSIKKTPNAEGAEDKVSQPSISSQKKHLSKRYFAISRRIKSFSPIHKDSSGKHIRFVSSSSEHEDDDDVDDDDARADGILSSQCKISPQNKIFSDRPSSCPYPSAIEEKARLGLKFDMNGQSSMASDGVTCDDNKRLSAKKRKAGNTSVDYPLKVPKKSKAELSENDLDLVRDSDCGTIQCIESNSAIDGVDKGGYLRLNDDAMEQFITTWKEACRLHSIPEVFDKMLQFYNSTDRRRKNLKSMFKSFPCIGLLYVAVTSIKQGMWDSLYDTFQTIGGREPTTSSSAPIEPESISVEPSSKRNTLSVKTRSSKLDCGISIDDICEKVSAYFDTNGTILIEGKSAAEKQLLFLRKLHDCQIWLAKQLSVEEFSSLGYGEFYRFLEEHPSLIPNELLESLFGDASKKSTYEVSMLPHQLEILLSQAASCLWEKDAITKEHIYRLLRKQFPGISFRVSGDGPVEDFSEFLKKNKDSNSSGSVLFSSTLLGRDSVRQSLLQNKLNLLENTEVKADMGLISGALGSVSTKDAVQCLLKAPMLSDVQSWSHWDLIYAPTLGSLVEWLLNEVYIKDLLCMVTKDGKVIRIDHSATVDHFLEALLKGSAFDTAVKLSSLLSLYGGERHVPLSLLKSHAQRGFENMLINSSNLVTAENNCSIFSHDGKGLKERYLLGETTVKHPVLSHPYKNVPHHDIKDQDIINKAVPVASRFILDCLCNLPSELQSFAADVLLSGLQSFTKDGPSAILRECNRSHQRLMLHSVGLYLNVCEWIGDFHAFSSGIESEMTSVGTSEAVDLSRTNCLDSKSNQRALRDLADSDDKMAIQSDEHTEVLGEVHVDKLNEVSTENSRDGCKSTLLKSDEDGSLIIESIRREEFGLVSSLTEADDIMLKKQHARLGRALQCLSQELYSQDSHFLLELVQNADDNLYSTNVEPTLVFILQSTGIVVLNNEHGFTAQNIRALCDVGNSTKKVPNAGYIGQKGIGFKSVFRVTDAPEIHSNGFHVKFDISEGQIGFVLPTVVSPCDIGSMKRFLPDETHRTDTSWNTCIVLPFKSKLRDGMGLSTILSLFSDLHPSLLLFLHRLQCIKFKNMLNGTYTVMKRETLEDGIVKVSSGNEIMSWFVANQNLQASVIRPGVETTKIAVAFTLKESSDSEYTPHLEQQPVFAFLPLRTYGLKFILQGDFVLPSSREEVDADSAWNQWLLSEFPGLFVSSLRSFCNLRCFQEKPGRAVAAYMSFVPLVGEVHGFFSQLPRMIISKLRITNCLLVEGKEEWVPPCRVVRGWNEQARVVLPDDLLHQHLGLGYLDKEISLSDPLSKALGVNDYGPRILIEIMSSVCRGDDGVKLLGLDWLASWLGALYMMLVHSSGQASVNAWVEADLSEMLRKIPFIPLSDGTYGSVAEGTIWLTYDAVNYGFEGEHEDENFPTLYANLRLVSPAFLSAAVANTNGLEELTVENVIKMLLKIGVQRLAAHELIRIHILPALSDDRTEEREKKLMTEYLSFVMLHLQSACPSCHTEREIIISELRSKAFVLTNHGFKRPAEVPIHFSREFGNPVDMSKFIDAVDFCWHEVDTMYLKHSSSKSASFGLTKWREFFQDLSITDFVQTVQVEKNMSDLQHTLLNELMCNGDILFSGLVAKDWESPELAHLLSRLSSQNNGEKSKYLLEVLDKMWDDSFSSKVTGCCICNSNGDVKQFQSSFIRSINDAQWMASSISQKLCYPKDLFYDCEEVRSILGNFAAYAVPQVRSRTFSSDIGLKTRVTVDDALETLQVLQHFKGPVTASIDQMSKLYGLIWGGMGTAKGEIAKRFSSGPSIFVPFTNNSRHGDVISGKLFSSDEVYWHDPTGSVDMTNEMLRESGFISVSDCSINKTLACVYQGLHDFFVNDCNVCEIPPPRSYIQILVQLSKVSLPSQAANSVLRVLLKWANDLKSGLMEPNDVAYLKECLLKLETTVLPTEQDKWVSLHPTFGLVCWCDNEELWKQFKHSDNINFLNFGELSLVEKEVLPANISGLMQALGVPSLSQVITREAIFYGMDDSREKALLVNWILPYAQRYIYKLHPDKYVQLKQSGLENIYNLRIVLVEKLFYRHTVKGCDNASNKRTECSCLLQENNLYISRTANSHEIFMELSRLLFGSPELHLSNFLHLITTMAESGSSEDQTENFIVNSQNIPKLPDEETVWFLSSLSSHHEVNTELSIVLPTVDDQIFSKFKRKPGSGTNWPPADWKSAPDFSLTRDNRFRPPPPPPPLPPPSDVVDWSIEGNSFTRSQDIGAREEKPLGGNFGRAEDINTDFNEREQLSFITPNEQQAAITGKTGEMVAYKYFTEKFNGGTKVKWVNEETETGLPYDIVVGENEESKEYIEVKATRSVRKDWFTISTREWQFAVERGESFSIAHVFLLGGNNAKVTVFRNPLRLCQQAMLKLAIVMPKTQEDVHQYICQT